MPLFQSRRLVPALILAAGLGAGLAASLAAGPARALPPLAENDRVLREFFAVAVGKEIVDNCPSIDARMMYLGIRTVELQNYVTSLGYTKADIDEMRKDPANKARLEAMRDSYLAKNGVVKGNAESYCTLGRAEIEKKTLIGVLLRGK